jgi:hypothetical protein
VPWGDGLGTSDVGRLEEGLDLSLSPYRIQVTIFR